MFDEILTSLSLRFLVCDTKIIIASFSVGLGEESIK